MVSPSLILTMLTLSGSAGSGRRLTTYSGLTYTTVPATASTIWTIMGAPHHEPSKRALSVPQAKLVPFDWFVISNAKTRKHPRGDTSAREQATKSRRIRSDQHLQHRAAFVGRKGDQVSENAKPTPSAPTGLSQQGAAAPASIDIPRVVIVLVAVATSSR